MSQTRMQDFCQAPDAGASAAVAASASNHGAAHGPASPAGTRRNRSLRDGLRSAEFGLRNDENQLIAFPPSYPEANPKRQRGGSSTTQPRRSRLGFARTPPHFPSVVVHELRGLQQRPQRRGVPLGRVGVA